MNSADDSVEMIWYLAHEKKVRASPGTSPDEVMAKNFRSPAPWSHVINELSGEVFVNGDGMPVPVAVSAAAGRSTHHVVSPAAELGGISRRRLASLKYPGGPERAKPKPRQKRRSRSKSKRRSRSKSKSKRART